jgi:hypothetical protein
MIQTPRAIGNDSDRARTSSGYDSDTIRIQPAEHTRSYSPDLTLLILLSFDQPHLLILRLAFPTPIRRHINAILFLLVSLLLCLVHCCCLVFSRRIDSIQDQRIGTSVDELVLRSCGYYDQVSCFDILVLSRNCCFSSARSEGQNLINGVFLKIGQSKGLETPSADGITSSPMSPPTGTVISTNWEYKPVQSTRRKSPDSEGRDVVMLGK